MSTALRSPTRPRPSAPPLAPETARTAPAVRATRGVMEAIVLGIIVLSPWAFGSAEPVFELMLHLAVAVLLALWGVRALLERRFTWRKCPVTLCLALLFMTSVLQLVPLPHAVLSTLSPATVRLYDQLLPTTPEVLPGDEPRLTAAPPAGSTLSLYPGATKRELPRLLAVLALFAVVRTNLTSARALRRLSLVAVVNGAALALVGLLQFFTSPHNLLYWTFPSPGQVFGPFVYRSHFACYVNLCLGLGVGLLLSLTRREQLASVGSSPLPGERLLDRLSGPLTLLQEPRLLWVAVALALMVCGVFFSLSRGGILALLGTGLVAGLLRFWRRPRASSLGGLVLGLGLATGLASWFDLGVVQQRLTTVWEGSAWHESRLPLWASAVPLIQEFPLWGTGLGTFQYVEPLHRTASVSADVIYDHAHNEYLEALVEGGVLRLLSSVVAVGIIVYLGCKAVRRHQGASTGGLAVGALLAFLTLALHSIGDFGLHLPAIAFLAAVLCAQLCALGEEGPHSAASREQICSEREFVFRLGGLAPALGALTLVLVGLVLMAEGWRLWQVEYWRFAAQRQVGQSDPETARRRIACLDQAARWAADSAQVQYELGQAHLDAWEHGVEHLHQRAAAAEAALPTFTLPVHDSVAGLGRALTFLSAQLLIAQQLDEVNRIAEEQLTRSSRMPALRHYLLARDLCPLLEKPQLRLALHRDALRQADPSTTYLERAKRVHGADPELWYLCGLQELLAGRLEQAWQDWRRSLTISDHYLLPILNEAVRHLDPEEISIQLLPEPTRLHHAATAAYLTEGHTNAPPRPTLDAAWGLLERDPSQLRGAELRHKGLLQRFLGQGEAALATYRIALARQPTDLTLRCELAETLFHQGQLSQARLELRAALEQQPGHERASELLARLNRTLDPK